MNGNLSRRQFPVSDSPSAHQQHDNAGLTTSRSGEMRGLPQRPLAVSSSTFGSAAQAAAWRLPDGKVLPFSKATAGSVFKPFGD